MNLCRSSVLGVDDMNRRQVISEIGRLRREYGVMEARVNTRDSNLLSPKFRQSGDYTDCALDSIYSKA